VSPDFSHYLDRIRRAQATVGKEHAVPILIGGWVQFGLVDLGRDRNTGSSPLPNWTLRLLAAAASIGLLLAFPAPR
jgi:hypothetical protein